MPEIVYNQTNEDNYIFDSDKIENVAGVFKLSPQISGAEAALYVKLDDNQGLVAIDSSGNNRHGAFQGGYTENNWTTGKINSAIVGISTSSGFINFNQLLSYERTDSFSLECWFNTTSTDAMSFISKQLIGSPFTGFSIRFASGKPIFVIRDNLGNAITAETTATYNDGNWHHVVMTYNGNSSHTGMTIYIDNNEDTNIITTGTLTGSLLLPTVDLQVSGREGNNVCIDSLTKIDEAVIYSRELSQAEVTFRWNGGNGTQELPGASTSFPTDNPTVPPADTFRAVEITSFDADIVEIGSDTVTFTIEVGGQEKYWNGSAWIDSTGYPNTNDKSTINSNISSLLSGETSNIRYVPYLHSDDGSTTPELNSVELNFNISRAAEEKEVCRIVFNQTKIDADPSIRQITVIPVPPIVKYKNTIIVREDPIILQFPDSGELEQDFLETENMSDPLGKVENPYYIFFLNTVKFEKFVPNAVTKNFFELEDA